MGFHSVDSNAFPRFFKEKKNAYWTAFFLSAFFTLLSIYIFPVLNPDGVEYLQSGQIFLNQGWHGLKITIQIRNWPFYYIILTGIHKTLHLSWINSAYLFDIIFDGMIAVTLLMIIDKLGYSVKYLWLGLGLFLAYHPFNKLRDPIIREHGYIFFLLISTLLLIYFLEKPSWKRGLLWSITLILATLFRIEGGYLLLLVPFAVFFIRGKSFLKRLYIYLQLNSIPLLSIFIIGMIIIFQLIPEAYLARIPQLWQGPLTYFSTNSLYFRRLHYATQLVNFPGQDDSPIFLWMGTFGTYLYNLLLAFTWPYLILFLIGFKSFYRRTSHAAHVALFAYFIVYVFITGAFYVSALFISTRYIVPFCLITFVIMLEGFRVLHHLWLKKKSIGISILFYGVILGILAMLVGSLYPFGRNKDYMVHAANWLYRNTPATARIYSNDGRIDFMSKRDNVSWKNAQKSTQTISTEFPSQWHQYDYFVLHIAYAQQHYKTYFENLIKQPPIQSFFEKGKDEKGDAIFIYRLF